MDETCDLQTANARPEQALDERHLLFRRDEAGLVLQAVPRADLDQFDGTRDRWLRHPLPPVISNFIWTLLCIQFRIHAKSEARNSALFAWTTPMSAPRFQVWGPEQAGPERGGTVHPSLPWRRERPAFAAPPLTPPQGQKRNFTSRPQVRGGALVTKLNTVPSGTTSTTPSALYFLSNRLRAQSVALQFSVSIPRRALTRSMDSRLVPGVFSVSK